MFETLENYTFIEQDPRLSKAALHLVNHLPHHVDIEIKAQSYTSKLCLEAHDLSLFSYTLSENRFEDVKSALKVAIESTKRFIVIIEPGTMDGYSKLMQARDFLIDQKLFLLAPCPNQKKCPLSQSDWCHFYQRLPRTSFQKALKNAKLGYEDEKFSYLIFSKQDLRIHGQRVLAFPVKRKSHIQFKLCTEKGNLEEKNNP